MTRPESHPNLEGARHTVSTSSGTTRSAVREKLLTPEQVADLLVRGIDAERFLIVDADNSVDVLVAKARDYDAWIAQMGTPL